MTTALNVDRHSDHGSDTVAELARRHPWLVQLARAGWVAKGIVYLVLGVLAASLVVGGGGGSDQEVSQTGAVAELAEAPLGGLALWAVAAGLALYVMWRLISIVLPAESSLSTWATRIGYAISAAVYVGLAWTAVSLATGRSGATSGGGQESQVDRITRELMEMTGGRWLVGLAGAAVIALGVYFAHRGWSEDFADDLEPGDVGPIDERTIRRLGTAGWIGRGVMTGLVGWFLLRAALTFDPEEAQGLDGALTEATGSTVGALLVAVVAVGLVLYGAYCVISAPRTRMHGAD